MYILYFKSYDKECQIITINKPRIRVAFVQDIYQICYFWQKGKLVLRSLLLEGHYFLGGLLLLGFANTCDFLLLLSEVRYF